jgi:heme exporter protein D
MNWHSAAEFFAMGGYGFYVWGSYLMALGLVVAEVWWLRRRYRAALQRVRRGTNQ